MKLNEIMLLLASVAIIVFVFLFMKKLKQPYKRYVSIISGLALLILTWVFAGDASWPAKIIITVLISYSIYDNLAIGKKRKLNI